MREKITCHEDKSQPPLDIKWSVPNLIDKVGSPPILNLKDTCTTRTRILENLL